MYHRDYLIRMIQQFIVFISQLAGLKKKDDPEVLLLKMESAYLQFTGMSMEALHSISADGIIDLYSVSGEPDYNRILVTAVLFKEESAILKSIHDDTRAEYLTLKSLELVNAVRQHESNLHGELQELLKKEFPVT